MMTKFPSDRIFPAVFLTLCFLSVPLSALDWHDGEVLERSGEFSGARDLYGLWLEENPGDPDYYPVLRKFLLLQETREQFFRELEKPRDLTTRQLAELYRWGARGAELSGDPEKAETWYLKAYNAHPFRENLEALLEACQMELVMGHYGEAETALAFLLREAGDTDLLFRAGLTRSRLLYLTGRETESREVWKELRDSRPDDRAVLIWGIYLASSSGAAELRAELETRFRELFPGEAEALLALRWGEPRNPDYLFGLYGLTAPVRGESEPEAPPSGSGRSETVVPAGGAGGGSEPLPVFSRETATDASRREEEGSALPAGTGTTGGTVAAAGAGASGKATEQPPAESVGAGAGEPAPAGVLVQTGAFRDPENAREQVRDLERLGFSSRVQTSLQGGAELHRVMVTGVTETGLPDVLNRLKAAGFPGFPVR